MKYAPAWEELRAALIHLGENASVAADKVLRWMDELEEEYE